MTPSFFPMPVDQSITPISQVAYMQDLGKHIRIVVNHHHLFEYRKQDKISKVLAIVTLLKIGAAKQTEIAHAFNITRDTARRYLLTVERYGSAGLFMNKSGPQSPHKINPKVHRFIVELLGEGQGVASILKSVKHAFSLELSRKSIERIRASLSTTKTAPRRLKPSVQEELLFEAEPQEEHLELDSPQGLMAKEATSSGESLKPGSPYEGLAGLFLLWPFLHLLGFDQLINTIFESIRARLFFVRESLLTIFLLAFLRCSSIEDYKRLEKRQLGLFWEGCRGMDLRTLRRKLDLLSSQNKALDFLTQLARRYQHIGLLELGILYFDGHFIPYYGQKNLHKGFFSQRRLAVCGQNQFFLNDRQGRPIFFWLRSADQTLRHMIPEAVEQIREFTGKDRFTIVFDRGGFSSRLFRSLEQSHITFITYHRGAQQPVDPSAFHPYSISYRYRKQPAELAELGYIGMYPARYRLIVRKKGEKQTFILTNDWHQGIDRIAAIMFNRWSQENFFKYMVREYHLDSLLSYLSEETSERVLVKNPARVENRRQKMRLEKKLQQLEHFLAGKLSEPRKRALSQKMEQRIQETTERSTQIKESIKQLNFQHKLMPAKIPASQNGDDRPREILFQEKKILVDSLKLMAYNAEEWLLDILIKKYRDHRDFRKVLMIILKQPGTIQRINGCLLIRINSLHNPRFQRTAGYLCEEMNRMKIPAPSGQGIIQFEVKNEQ
jgi:hypothetical protein